MKKTEIIFKLLDETWELRNKIKEMEVELEQERKDSDFWYQQHQAIKNPKTDDSNHYDTIPAMPGEYQKEEPLTGEIGEHKE